MASFRDNYRRADEALERWLRRIVTKKNWRRWRHWLIFVPVLPILLVIGMYISIVLGFKSPEAQLLGVKGIEIQDRNGNVLYTFSDEPGSSRIVPLSEISPDLIAATVAAEDANYWKNPGVNQRGILRAIYENLAFWKYGGFFKGSGGSSITQQLAKNLYIKPEDRIKRSPLRKLKETLLAFELNRRYSKEEILQWYLSDVYYGNGAYGIESASYRYFNKAPKDLTLAEATMLAGIPRAPSYYDPIGNIEAATGRQQEVLSLMVRHDVINAGQASEVTDTPVELQEGRNPNSGDSQEMKAPHWATYIREILPAILGETKISKQLQVKTTLDSRLQDSAEELVKSKLDVFEKQYGASNGALVAMDPKTGEILAMVGSHDFFRDDISGQVNNAISLNNPGSTMKPITYLTAFLKGWAPSTIVVDEPITIGDGAGAYTLGNADLRYRGAVPVRTALGSSLNVPAVKALEYASFQQVYDMAKRLGISTLKEEGNYGVSFTLGGVDVSLLDMTYVYSVFANQGEQAGINSVQNLPKGNRTLDPIAVLEVSTLDGKKIYSAKKEKERLVAANAVYLVTNVISDDNARVSMFGAGSALNLPGRPSAAKSGSSDATRDAWTIGFTPSLVAGVWVGNASNRPMTGATSTNTAAQIWQAFMTAALKDRPVEQFKVPEGVVTANVCATTGLAPTPGCPRVISEVFLAVKTPQGLTPAVTLTPRPVVTNTPLTQPTLQLLTPRPTSTPRPIETPVDTPTPRPTSTPRATSTPRPTDTPDPNATPRPTSTPRPGNGNGPPGRRD